MDLEKEIERLWNEVDRLSAYVDAREQEDAQLAKDLKAIAATERQN